MTCAHSGRDQIAHKSIDASFSPFGHPTQVKLLVFKNILYFFGDLSVLASKLASSQVSAQVKLTATCESAWPEPKQPRVSDCPVHDQIRPF